MAIKIKKAALYTCNHKWQNKDCKVKVNLSFLIDDQSKSLETKSGRFTLEKLPQDPNREKTQN